jgi:lipopolysaccharide/colanic/teichoic acid biosynthesis glycosyltransferase
MFKRLFDLLLTCFTGILFSPFILILAIFVRYFMGSPIVFTQQRPGLNTKPFYIYKFRTMNSAKDELGNLLPDVQRLTKFGQFLRSTSLDELPSLWNVFKGEMSLVGPRPLLMEYIPLYNIQQALGILLNQVLLVGLK